jgi:hypothetical protein
VLPAGAIYNFEVFAMGLGLQYTYAVKEIFILESSYEVL